MDNSPYDCPVTRAALFRCRRAGRKPRGTVGDMVERAFLLAGFAAGRGLYSDLAESCAVTAAGSLQGEPDQFAVAFATSMATDAGDYAGAALESDPDALMQFCEELP